MIRRRVSARISSSIRWIAIPASNPPRSILSRGSCNYAMIPARSALMQSKASLMSWVSGWGNARTIAPWGWTESDAGIARCGWSENWPPSPACIVFRPILLRMLSVCITKMMMRWLLSNAVCPRWATTSQSAPSKRNHPSGNATQALFGRD